MKVEFVFPLWTYYRILPLPRYTDWCQRTQCEVAQFGMRLPRLCARPVISVCQPASVAKHEGNGRTGLSGGGDCLPTD